MTFDILIMQVFSGFSLFSVLVLMAIGLTIVFGLMGVINMAHGELMALGAYMTYLTALVFERWLPGLMGAYFIVGIFVAFAVTFAFGYLLERCFIRFMYTGHWTRCWPPGACPWCCSRSIARCSAPRKSACPRCSGCKVRGRFPKACRYH
jgi:hypothetical protein